MEGKSKASRRKKPWRYRWPDPVRDEVLVRLLAFSAGRAEEERLAVEAIAQVTKFRPVRRRRARSADTNNMPQPPERLDEFG